MILVTIALFGIALVFIHRYLKWNYEDWCRLGVPGPKPKVLIGNCPNKLFGKDNIIYDFDRIYYEYKREFRAIGLFCARDPELLVLSPDLAQEIMVTHFSKFRNNVSGKRILDKDDKFVRLNPFFANDAAWKERRTDVLGGLTSNKLKLAYPIWRDTAKKLSEFLNEKTNATGKVILETKNLSFRYTVAILGDFLWGIDADTFNSTSENNAMMDKAKRMLEQCYTAMSLYYSLSLVPFLRRFICCRNFPAETDDYFSQLTKDAIEFRQRNPISRNRMDYLNYILQLQEKKGLTLDDVTGYLLAPVVDGYETAAGVIHNTLFYLAKYPEVQEKLRSEIMNNLDENGLPSFDTLNGLPYLNQCVFETIRIISPVSAFSRVCTEHTTINIAEHKPIPIKPGMVITVPSFSYHHDPEFYPEPYKYKPERFNNAAHVELTKKGRLMAFGDGPRICVGMRMGLLQVKTFLAQILTEYRIKCCDETMNEKRPDSQGFILGFDGDIFLEYERL